VTIKYYYFSEEAATFALRLAARADRLSTAAMLLSSGADINGYDPRERPEPRSPLTEAARMGSWHVFDFLKGQGELIE